jgi:hypothetical protein
MMNSQTLKIEQENTMDYKLIGEKIQPLGGDIDILHLFHGVEPSIRCLIRLKRIYNF